MIRFVKAHAYGNDFLYVRADALADVRLDAFARELCDRHTGVGADGLIVYEPTPDGASMRLFNADGGRAEVSGNGVRALGAILLNGIESNAPVSREITIYTEAGPKLLTLVGLDGAHQMFRAAMGGPRDLRQISVSVDGEALSPIVMDMGNPQAVLLGPLPDAGRLQTIGAALQRHPAFPAGTNLEFAEVEALDRVRILIWERGVGPTTSSGTGSCAALVAAAAFGGASRIADVVAPGGAQRVEWQDDSVYLTGWAEVLCSGEWHRQVPRTS
jgi:diaminopimelate epimerase